MQAIMQPQLVKIASSATQTKGAQPTSTGRSPSAKKAGSRFLNFLMATLSGWAV
jgi:hypothetical protein